MPQPAAPGSRNLTRDEHFIYKEGIAQQDAGKRTAALAGWSAHPAYVKGARRLSCSLCILGNLETLRAGAYHQPEYYRALVWLEIEVGCPFQAHRWLADVAPERLDRGAARGTG